MHMHIHWRECNFRAQVLALRPSPRLLLLAPPPALPVNALERTLARAHAQYPLAAVGVGNLDKHAINTLLAPAVRAAALALAVPVLDLQAQGSGFGGCPNNRSVCCALLARDGLHTSARGAAVIASQVYAWMRRTNGACSAAPSSEMVALLDGKNSGVACPLDGEL